jgi:predicted ATPase
VAILSAKPGALLLLENPEAHLHPKGQAVLAELMVRAAKCGVQIVVETHSDHLINRLRRLVAEDLSNELAGLINILFVQQSDDQRSSYIEPLRLNEEGQIENWPPNFLIETAEDARAIVKAGIAKRRQMKGTNTP